MLTRLFAILMVMAGFALGAFGIFIFIGSKSVFQETLAGVFCLGGLILGVNGLVLDSLFASVRKCEQRLSEQISKISLTTRVEVGRPGVGGYPAAAVSPTPRVKAAEPSVLYYYADSKGAENGPHDRTAMRRLAQLDVIGIDTPVFRDGDDAWRTFADFPELLK